MYANKCAHTCCSPSDTRAVMGKDLIWHLQDLKKKKKPGPLEYLQIIWSEVNGSVTVTHLLFILISWSDTEPPGWIDKSVTQSFRVTAHQDTLGFLHYKEKDKKKSRAGSLCPSVCPNTAPFEIGRKGDTKGYLTTLYSHLTVVAGPSTVSAFNYFQVTAAVVTAIQQELEEK